MLHQGADTKPEAVEEGEVVLHHVRAGVAGVGVVPLVGAEPWWENRESARISGEKRRGREALGSVSIITQRNRFPFDRANGQG